MKKQVVVTALTGSAMFITCKVNAQSADPGAFAEYYHKVPIQWVDSVPGDFSFTAEWLYAPGIHRSEWGELISYDSKTTMPGSFDNEGRLNKDSITEYYKKTDTSHFFCNTRWEASCDPANRTGTDVLTVDIKRGNIFCTNSFSGRSNCKFRMNIRKDTASMLSVIVDVLPVDDIFFNGITGYMRIDKKAWVVDEILKAEFYFEFRHPYNKSITHYRKGLLYIPLKNNAENAPAFIIGKKK